MKLDPRIILQTDILTCFDIERARPFIGEMGYFTDCFNLFENVATLKYGFLENVSDDDCPFLCKCSNWWRFFIPESSLKPGGKKKWRPFTLDELRAKFPLLSPVTIRRKRSEVSEAFCFVGYTANGAIILGGDWRKLDNLFIGYELKDKDCRTPFGVEDE